MAQGTNPNTQGPNLPNIRRRMRQQSTLMRNLQAELEAFVAAIPSPSRAEYEVMGHTGLLTFESLYLSACALAAFHLEVTANILEDFALTPTAFTHESQRTRFRLRSQDLFKILRNYVPRTTGEASNRESGLGLGS